MDSTLATEPLGYLDEAAISNLLAVFAPFLTEAQGMRGTENEARARVALRTFMVRCQGLRP